MGHALTEMHAAMENFAEAWIAANMPNYLIDTQGKQLPEQQVAQYIIKNAQVNDQKKSLNCKDNVSGSTTDSTGTTCQLSRTATSLLGVKTISLRCVVEQDVSLTTTTLSDCQIFLPGSLLFLDIVRGALVKLGFAVSEAIAAKGSIQLQNWKAVEVERLTDDAAATIEQMLGHIAAICTLRIKLNKQQLDEIEWDEQAVRCAVLKLLKQHNQVHLSRICPIPQSMISNIANSKYSTRLCAQKCKQFGEWFAEYQHGVSVNAIEYPNTSTRLTFHPTYELPLLREWYQQCPNPSTEELKKFLVELNMAPVRQERGKVPLRRLRVWWRNEKQRLRRHEMDEGMKVEVATVGRKRKRRKRRKTTQEAQCTELHTNVQECDEDGVERGECLPPPAHSLLAPNTALFNEPLFASSLF